VIERVNWNSGQMDFLLRGVKRSAVGLWRRGSDGLCPDNLFDMKVFCSIETSHLYLRMEHTLGGTIEGGSNNREFWVWEGPRRIALLGRARMAHEHAEVDRPYDRTCC
jgi:hypothetical protein